MTVHLTFTGREARIATIVIKEGTIEVTDGFKEKSDLRIECDSESLNGRLNACQVYYLMTHCSVVVLKIESHL